MFTLCYCDRRFYFRHYILLVSLIFSYNYNIMWWYSYLHVFEHWLYALPFIADLLYGDSWQNFRNVNLLFMDDFSSFNYWFNTIYWDCPGWLMTFLPGYILCFMPVLFLPCSFLYCLLLINSSSSHGQMLEIKLLHEFRIINCHIYWIAFAFLPLNNWRKFEIEVLTII